MIKHTVLSLNSSGKIQKVGHRVLLSYTPLSQRQGGLWEDPCRGIFKNGYGPPLLWELRAKLVAKQWRQLKTHTVERACLSCRENLAPKKWSIPCWRKDRKKEAGRAEFEWPFSSFLVISYFCRITVIFWRATNANLLSSWTKDKRIFF